MAVYEYFITFDREVEVFWQRRFTFITLLWFLVSVSVLRFRCSC